MATIAKKGRKADKQKGRPVLTLDQLNRLYEREKASIEAITQVSDSGETERWERCLDKHSFGGKCYCPSFVVSSFGRVWGLEKGENGGLLTPFWSRSRREEGYLKLSISKSGRNNINPNKNVYVHDLVANYFCDLDHEQRDLMMEKGRARNQNDFDVHHISLNALLIDDPLLINKWDNLQYIGKSHHRALHKLLNVMATNDEKKKEKRLKNFNKKYGQLFEQNSLEELGLNAYSHRWRKHNKLMFTYRRETEQEQEESRKLLEGLPEGSRIDPIIESITTTIISTVR